MPGIAAATRMGEVHLTVADRARSIEFYERVIGLRHEGDGRLSAGGEDLLVLHEEPGAQPAPRHTGLFHFALLLPTRADLAAWLDHAARLRVELTGASDHLVSEALYLRDPDHHGIEIYRDRPADQWERDGEHVRMATLPLDLRDVMSALDGPFDGMPRGTTMGHVHLQVADIAATEQFYAGVLGFDIRARYGNQATFLSAGGYHHHLGANVWNSSGAAPPPPGSAALRHAVVVVPDETELERIAAAVGAEPDGDAVAARDPSQNGLVFRVART